MGRSQVVRQRILIPPFPGSNPGAPAIDRATLSPFFRAHFQRSWEHSREIFVPLLISPCSLVRIELLNRIDRDLGIAWQIMRSQNRLHVAGLVAGDRINLRAKGRIKFDPLC